MCSNLVLKINDWLGMKQPAETRRSRTVSQNVRFGKYIKVSDDYPGEGGQVEAELNFLLT